LSEAFSGTVAERGWAEEMRAGAGARDVGRRKQGRVEQGKDDELAGHDKGDIAEQAVGWRFHGADDITANLGGGECYR
jgi:hypothetical protein